MNRGTKVAFCQLTLPTYITVHCCSLSAHGWWEKEEKGPIATQLSHRAIVRGCFYMSHFGSQLVQRVGRALLSYSDLPVSSIQHSFSHDTLHLGGRSGFQLLRMCCLEPFVASMFAIGTWFSLRSEARDFVVRELVSRTSVNRVFLTSLVEICVVEEPSRDGYGMVPMITKKGTIPKRLESSQKGSIIPKTPYSNDGPDTFNIEINYVLRNKDCRQVNQVGSYRGYHMTLRVYYHRPLARDASSFST